jgi:hypothetical protein
VAAKLRQLWNGGDCVRNVSSVGGFDEVETVDNERDERDDDDTRKAVLELTPLQR